MVLPTAPHHTSFFELCRYPMLLILCFMNSSDFSSRIYALPDAQFHVCINSASALALIIIHEESDMHSVVSSLDL